MATICVQVGQAGNQLGSTLYSSLAEQGAEQAEVWESWFRESKEGPRVARAILLDSEQKVVQTALTTTGGSWTYCRANAAVRAAGAANNWALGFQHGAVFQEDLQKSLHRELEAADSLATVVLLHSVAGGTGSGLGASCASFLRDELGTRLTFGAVSVWPFAGGEVAVQHYNALLSLASVSEEADLVFLCENGRYSDLVRFRETSAGRSKRIQRDQDTSFHAINRAICTDIMMGGLPVSRPGGVTGSALGDSLRLLGCAHPAFNIGTMRHAPQLPRMAQAFQSDSPAALASRLLRAAEKGTIVDESASGAGAHGPMKIYGAVGFARGVQLSSEAQKTLPMTLTNSCKAAPLAASAMWTNDAAVASVAASASFGLWTVDSTPAMAIEHVAGRAATMLHGKLYVHHYEQYGVGRDAIAEAAATCAGLAHSVV